MPVDASLLGQLAESSMRATSDARSLLAGDRTLAVHEIIAFMLPLLVMITGSALLCRVRALLRVRRAASRSAKHGADGARHAQHSDAPGSPRDFSEVDLTLTKDHWDPLSDARWSQAADIVSLFSD